MECRSGLYINALQLISPANLVAAMPQINISHFPEWFAAGYKRNAVVRVGGILFIANEPTQATDNPVNGGPWAVTNIISATLRFLLDAAVAEVVNKLANANKLAGAKTVVADTHLYHGAGNISNRIIKEGRFCGFEIVVKEVRDLAIRLRSIGIQSDTPNPGLPIYIYHTTTSAPIKVLNPQFAGSGTFSWAAVADALLTLESSAYAPGGAFLVGYYEDDVVGQMIERETLWPNYDLAYDAMLRAADCSHCNPANYDALRSWSKYSEIHPFTVRAGWLNPGRELWGYNRQVYDYRANYGLNLDVAVECDITQFLANNEMLLADAIHKAATLKILELFTASIEDNPIAEQARIAAAYLVDNKENRATGLIAARDAAIKGLSLEVANGSPCAPAIPTDAPKQYLIYDGSVGDGIG